MKGSFYSRQREYFSIVTNYQAYIHNSECNISFFDYRIDVEYIELALIVANEYIDPKNFEDPIQVVVKDHYYTLLELNSQTYMDVYVKK